MEIGFYFAVKENIIRFEIHDDIFKRKAKSLSSFLLRFGHFRLPAEKAHSFPEWLSLISPHKERRFGRGTFYRSYDA